MSQGEVFDWEKWLADTKCLSVAARGVWITLLSLMARSEKKGVLTWNPCAWATECGIKESEIAPILKEIIDMKVASLKGDLFHRSIVNRRMARRPKRTSWEEVAEWWNDLAELHELPPVETPFSVTRQAQYRKRVEAVPKFRSIIESALPLRRDWFISKRMPKFDQAVQPTFFHKNILERGMIDFAKMNQREPEKKGRSFAELWDALTG